MNTLQKILALVGNSTSCNNKDMVKKTIENGQLTVKISEKKITTQAFALHETVIHHGSLATDLKGQYLYLPNQEEFMFITADGIYLLNDLTKSLSFEDTIGYLEHAEQPLKHYMTVLYYDKCSRLMPNSEEAIENFIRWLKVSNEVDITFLHDGTIAYKDQVTDPDYQKYQLHSVDSKPSHVVRKVNLLDSVSVDTDTKLFKAFSKNIATSIALHRSKKVKFNHKKKQFYTEKDMLMVTSHDNQIIEKNASDIKDKTLVFEKGNQHGNPYYVKLTEDERYDGINEAVKAEIISSLKLDDSPFRFLESIEVKQGSISQITLNNELLHKLYRIPLWTGFSTKFQDSNKQLHLSNWFFRVNERFSQEELNAIKCLAYYLAQNQPKKNDYIYLIFPALIVLWAVLEFHGLIVISGLTVCLLHLIASLCYFVLQFVIGGIQNSKLEQLYDKAKLITFFSWPVIVYNVIFIGLANFVYYYFSANPLVTLIAYASIASLAPITTRVIENLRMNLIYHVADHANHQHNTDLWVHAILPSALGLMGILAAIGSISLPLFSSLLIATLSLSMMIFQYTVYTSKADFTSHNLIALSAGLLAYTLFMTNPLAAMVAVTAVMTTAPGVSAVYGRISTASLFNQNPYSSDMGSPKAKPN